MFCLLVYLKSINVFWNLSYSVQSLPFHCFFIQQPSQASLETPKKRGGRARRRLHGNETKSSLIPETFLRVLIVGENPIVWVDFQLKSA